MCTRLWFFSMIAKKKVRVERWVNRWNRKIEKLMNSNHIQMEIPFQQNKMRLHQWIKYYWGNSLLPTRWFKGILVQSLPRYPSSLHMIGKSYIITPNVELQDSNRIQRDEEREIKVIRFCALPLVSWLLTCHFLTVTIPWPRLMFVITCSQIEIG